MSKLTTPFLLNFLEMVLLRGFQERCNTPPTGARRRRHLVKSCSYFLVKSNAVSISWHHITSSKAESRKVLWVFHHQKGPYFRLGLSKRKFRVSKARYIYIYTRFTPEDFQVL